MYNEGHRSARMVERGNVALAIRATVARTDATNVAHVTTPASRVRKVGIVYETTVGRGARPIYRYAPSIAINKSRGLNRGQWWREKAVTESPRDLRRLLNLRRWSHEQIKSFFPGST